MDLTSISDHLALRRLGPVTAVALLALAACGSGSDADQSDDTSDDTASGQSSSGDDAPSGNSEALSTSPLDFSIGADGEASFDGQAVCDMYGLDQITGVMAERRPDMFAEKTERGFGEPFCRWLSQTGDVIKISFLPVEADEELNAGERVNTGFEAVAILADMRIEIDYIYDDADGNRVWPSDDPDLGEELLDNLEQRLQ